MFSDIASTLLPLLFRMFHVKHHFIRKRNGKYKLEKEYRQTLVAFQFIASIVLYQKLLSESRRDEFNF